MRRYLNTLYVTTEGAWLRKDGANIVVELDGAERMRVPVHMLGGLVCVGRVSASSALLGFCAESGVTVTYLNTSGRFLARVEGPVSGNVLLRREQYRRTDEALECAALARCFVLAKILNQRTVIRRALRDHAPDMAATSLDALEAAERRLTDTARRAQLPQSTESLRGIEGEAAQVYFAVFGYLIRGDSDTFRFEGRSRRPPLDPANALISFLYTLLTHDCRSALETFGLDPAVGFLHRDRPGRPSLALDLLEEFRPVLADRIALSMINRRQLDTRDFRIMENGAVLLVDDARKKLLTTYQERKKEEISHPFLGEKAPFGLMPHLQAQLLARTLRGDLDLYPPFVWK
ncbi:type I-C CRISPR-associated endonuclease Cas1c [Marinivivus vitaminiproducens]|uniref:type I-C CRISPR-associated endonuclease Cas1c n=1 Tax=Marinivivus vitaminiproducens TaxID=3035935 RepID=UPI0027A32DF8|nr:type I-C CRISPR-associated endonuclease Cas1c [Geminicoccaceae bacterium SCSIO 64248]